jgi:hypothetical protein
MFPWSIEHFHHTLFGADPHTILRRIIKGANDGQAPDKGTTRKLLNTNQKVRRSTLEPFNAGIICDIRTDKAWTSSFEQMEATYRGSFECYFAILDQWFKQSKFEDSSIFLDTIFQSLRRLISTIIHLEDWAQTPKDVPFGIRELKPKESIESLRQKIATWTNEEKILLFELQAFVLYLAAFELDVEEWQESKFEIIRISKLLPDYDSTYTKDGKTGRAIYPMEQFWRWFMEIKCKCASIPELTEKLISSEQKADGKYHYETIKNAFYTDSMEHVIGWGKLRAMLAQFENDSEPVTTFKAEVLFAYGMTRMLQEHCVRCRPLVEEHFCEKDQIETFYQSTIETYKKNECRGIPLHPWFKEGD